MFWSKKPNVSISIAKEALESIFDECDRYDIDETGGRLVGNYSHGRGRSDVQVLAVIPAGPKARRSPTSLFQDGEYQEEVFRSIEEVHPEVEHLGSWHTHHVNGYPGLSDGDKRTYFNTVNHEKYNLEFFYVLLVVRKTPGGKRRYGVRHFIFRRKDDTIYEVHESQVRLVDTRVLWPTRGGKLVPQCISSHEPLRQSTPNLQRAKDQEFFSEFYPHLRALSAKGRGTLYWKGALPLVDGSQVDVVAMEDDGDEEPSYLIAAADRSPIASDVSRAFRGRRFRSARHAVLQLEKELNQATYRSKKG